MLTNLLKYIKLLSFKKETEDNSCKLQKSKRIFGDALFLDGGVRVLDVNTS